MLNVIILRVTFVVHGWQETKLSQDFEATRFTFQNHSVLHAISNAEEVQSKMAKDSNPRILGGGHFREAILNIVINIPRGFSVVRYPKLTVPLEHHFRHIGYNLPEIALIIFDQKLTFEFGKSVLIRFSNWVTIGSTFFRNFFS